MRSEQVKKGKADIKLSDLCVCVCVSVLSVVRKEDCGSVRADDEGRSVVRGRRREASSLRSSPWHDAAPPGCCTGIHTPDPHTHTLEVNTHTHIFLLLLLFLLC